MLDSGNLIEILKTNPASEVEVELETFEDNGMDYVSVAKAAGRKFRMIEAISPSEDGGLALYVRRIVFEPNVGGQA